MQIFSAFIYLRVCYIFVHIKLICEQMKLKYVAIINTDAMHFCGTLVQVYWSNDEIVKFIGHDFSQALFLSDNPILIN